MASQNDIFLLQKAIDSESQVSFDYPQHGTGIMTTHEGKPSDFRDSYGAKHKIYNSLCHQVYVFASHPKLFMLSKLLNVR